MWVVARVEDDAQGSARSGLQERDEVVLDDFGCVMPTSSTRGDPSMVCVPLLLEALPHLGLDVIRDEQPGVGGAFPGACPERMPGGEHTGAGEVAFHESTLKMILCSTWPEACRWSWILGVLAVLAAFIE